MRTWVSAELEVLEPVSLGGHFTPVALLISQAWGQRSWASGFLVHPRIVLTAAHAVTFAWGNEKMVAGRIQVDLGSVRAWADGVALPAEYLGPSAWDGSADVAALRLPWAVCMPEDVVSLSQQPMGQALPATLWGWEQGELCSLPVDARPVDGAIRYVSPNLPGCSGGPLIAPQGQLTTGRAFGIHRAFHLDEGRGEAAVISFADAKAAMQSLGFTF